MLLVSASLFAQQKQVETKIDVTKNKIGAQFNLTLKTNVDTLSNVVFPKGANFGKMEVIRSYVVDTIKKGDRYELIKKYGLAQFDSGKFTIPSLKVLINKKEFLTDSFLIEVSSIKVDTLKQKMYDIKPVAEASSSKSWIWKLLLILLIIATIGVAVYWFVRKRQKKTIEEEIYKTPIEKATSLLNTLEKKELWQKGEVKNYYSELTNIARTYIEEAIEIPAMESTTSELIEGLRIASQRKKMSLSQETIENLEKVLKQADLVKFAKSKPLDFEITEDRKKIERSIITLDKSIPVVVETEDDMLLNELQRQEQLKIQLRKKRTRRILISAAAVLFLLIATTTYFIVTKGFDYVKDNVLGHPTKELLEGEWVTSSYGNPNVTIETPKVLKRLDTSKMLPKELIAALKSSSMFAYGSMLDDYYILVNTMVPKQPTEVDLSKSLDGSIQEMQNRGAQNILKKQTDFQTKEGIEGLKGYGTMELIDPVLKQSHKMYFEILIFKQDQGIQQVIIMSKEGDKYASQITDRIIKSVEFKKEKTNE